MGPRKPIGVVCVKSERKIWILAGTGRYLLVKGRKCESSVRSIAEKNVVKLATRDRNTHCISEYFPRIVRFWKANN
jgi:hypothetical protein